MGEKIDQTDRRILTELQRDATLSVEEMASRINLSRNACWRRMRRLEGDGFVRERVALIDAEKLGVGLSAFVFVRTSSHDPGWLRRFRDAVAAFPEIVGVYRTSGDLDYVLRIRISDVKAYDRLYQRLIAKVPLADVSASFVMEDIKETTAIPLEIR